MHGAAGPLKGNASKNISMECNIPIFRIFSPINSQNFEEMFANSLCSESYKDLPTWECKLVSQDRETLHWLSHLAAYNLAEQTEEKGSANTMKNEPL